MVLVSPSTLKQGLVLGRYHMWEQVLAGPVAAFISAL